MFAGMCACLGPQNGEPLCPCKMRAAREYMAPGYVVQRPQGCICPPGSEATCQGIACPRRAFSFNVGALGQSDTKTEQ